MRAIPDRAPAAGGLPTGGKWPNQHREPKGMAGYPEAQFIETGGVARKKEIGKGPGKAKSKRRKDARTVQAWPEVISLL